jgi:tetratricopeptide (TPR) repeat protein
LLNRKGQHEEALGILSLQARVKGQDQTLHQAFGVSLLRLPFLPTELPERYGQLLLAAGKAAALVAVENTEGALEAFDELIQRFPGTPHVHYSFGMFLLRIDRKRALEEFKRELNVSPKHLQTYLQLALNLWTEGETNESRDYARRAVTLYPESPAARFALGRILLNDGELEEAIKNLELAKEMVPGNPELLLALQRAYSRAGRAADSAKVREEYLRVQGQTSGAGNEPIRN